MKKFIAKLERALPLNHDVYQFDFRYEGEHVDFLPGQFFMLEVPTPERKLTRSYSISSEPTLENTFSLCVKLLPDGVGSALLKNLKPGDEASFMAAFGHFTVKENTKDLVFVATGTGLAPFLSMIPHLLKAGVTKPIKLYFGVRHDEDLFFVDQLRAWEHAYPNFKAVITLSQPSESWMGDKGRVTEHLDSMDFANSTVYICGNGDMVKSVKDLLDSKGVAKEDICLEQFTPLK